MPACHAGGREFESRPDRKSASHKDLRFCFYKQIVENESVMSFIDEITRARKASLAIEKAMKEFRKASIEAAK